jgi:methyl-accepting chemotaxis protein
MAFYNNLSLARKFMLVLLFVGIVPMLVISELALRSASSTLDAQIHRQLEAVRDLKADAIKRHFDQASAQIVGLAAQPATQDALKQFSSDFAQVSQQENWDSAAQALHSDSLQQYYKNDFQTRFGEQNDGDKADIDPLVNALSPTAAALQSLYISGNSNPLGSKHLLNRAEGAAQYHETHKRFHPGFAQYLQQFGLYDIFLVDSNTGDIVYTVFKEVDFTTNLLDGAYAKTNLGRAFMKARNLKPGTSVVEDYVMYLPSYNLAASFIATPVFDGDTQVGVLIFQLPLEPINQIMTQRSGMGDTGESYLLGPDMLMRSDSYLDPINHTVAASFRHPEKGSVNTDAAKSVLAGNKGSDLITDYNGNPVLSAYTPIDLGHFTWGLLVEIDEAEAFASINTLKQQTIYSMVAAMVLIMLLAWFNAALLAKPIAALSACLQRAKTEGNFRLKVDVDQKDEIGMMARAFNALMDDISTTITATNRALKALALGNYDEKIQHIHAGDLGNLATGVNLAIDKIQIANSNTQEQAVLTQANMERANAAATQAEKSAQDALILKEALDNANTSTMIIDTSFNIIYLNDSMRKLLERSKSDFEKALGTFRPEQLLGKDIANLTKVNPTLNTLVYTKAKTGADVCTFGKTSFVVNTTAILNKEAKYVGKILEWQDRTAELATEAEIDQVVTAASRGDFTKQLLLDNKQGFSLVISRGLNKMVHTTRNAMHEVKEVLSRLAEGDLTHRMQQEYEGDFAILKRDTNLTIDRLNEVVANIADASSVIASSSQEIAAGINDLSSRTEDQASSLQETAACMDQMLKTVDTNLNSAKKCNELANGSYTFARDGSESVQKSVTAMQDIEKSSGKIANIVSVIDGIAFQTNLLALNAAVEAARAGEQGRGFAVVATEVRQLAQRSANAAREIKELIGTSVEKIRAGTSLASTSGETLSLMVSEIQGVSSMMGDIMTSAQEQAAGIDKVNVAISRIDAITQQNVALVEEAYAAGETMANKAREMDELVSFFKRAATKTGKFAESDYDEAALA